MLYFITLNVTLFLVFVSIIMQYFGLSRRVIKEHRPGLNTITFENSVQILNELKVETKNSYLRDTIGRAIMLRRMSYFSLAVIAMLLFINGLWGVFF